MQNFNEIYRVDLPVLMWVSYDLSMRKISYSVFEYLTREGKKIPVTAYFSTHSLLD